MKAILVSAAACAALLLGGCLGADTSDPTKGGLFGYSPSTYNQRIQDKQEQLDALDAENARVQEENTALEAAKAKKQADVAAQQKKLNSVNAEIKKLKGQISSTEAAPAASSGLTDAQKAAQIKKMQQQLKALESEAEALSRL